MTLNPSPARSGARRARICVGLLVAAALALASASDALAASSTISLKGPHTNVFGTAFHYTASGFAAARANYVYGWEAPYSAKCATSLGAERKRSSIALFTSKSVSKNKHFSLLVRFFARNTERHRFCAYLVNKASGKTFARAEATWQNVAATPSNPTTPPSTTSLQPAPVGQGQCQAKRFPDNSAYAQIAIAGTNCETFEAVAFGADGAKGAAYSRSGFACKSSTEGAGSTWQEAWTGTYYAYACSSGSMQVAFNWGTEYAYVPASTLPTVSPQG